MSAFNTVTAPITCPNCGLYTPMDVQFKYGDTWQHQYQIGDRLRWGGNDIGKPGRELVLAFGIGGPCPRCGTDDLEFEVVIRRDEIVGVQLAQPGRTWGPDRFIVVKP